MDAPFWRAGGIRRRLRSRPSRNSFGVDAHPRGAVADDAGVRLVRHTVLPGDITSVHDVPVVITSVVLGGYLMLAAALTGGLYAAGDAWMWQHWELVGGVASKLVHHAACSVMIVRERG